MLRGVIIWTPMLMTDGLEAAEERERIFIDYRVQHYWDSNRIFGKLLSRTLRLKATIAWDVYLIYPPEHIWSAELPPQPDFWMHQLDEELALHLDPLKLKQSVQGMIERFKQE